MYPTHDSALWALLEATAGARRTNTLLHTLEVHPSLLTPQQGPVPRAVLAQALTALLFEDLLRRVPYAHLYVEELRRSGRKVTFDHGALRTVKAPSGLLPEGEAAFTRLLLPLGYRLNGTYPLERLGMTGRAYAHEDLPEHIPQFFLSELHPERFSPAFQEATRRVLATSVDPLPPSALALLEQLRLQRELPLAQAARLLPDLVACFERHHAPSHLADYELLLAESKEMAWIATEGNAFNHATDRVEDVAALAEAQKALGRPMKEALEVGSSGRVVQTAFRAAQVERPFVGPQGQLVLRSVPGSFYEFITRKPLPDGRLDLSFDSSNAQGIFKMTEAGEGRQG
jgi:hypothetical protein